MNGVLVADKPLGPTSHDVVARVRQTLGLRRIGHTGTLDPLATGVLPLVVGQATRLASLLSASVKEYAAEAGRDPGTVRCSLRWYLDPEGQREPSKGLQGSTSEIVDQIGRLADIGVDHLVLDPVASGGFDGRLAAVERFAADVMPQI